MQNSFQQKRKPNRLIQEKSPYLLQHAYNPVNWYPWGDEAFDTAAVEGKPVFLSIGYSTCHWCHVMAHESFEDPEVARLLNKTFISVKVDREERPDIDNVYMTACRTLTGGGGWPLTIIMTPHKEPFYAATYIPKRGSFGNMGLIQLIDRVHELWDTRRKDLLDAAGKVTLALQNFTPASSGEKLHPAITDEAFRELAARYDEEYGGFGPAPKFPTPHNIIFLLRYWNRTGNNKALEMAEKTLSHMRNGGIFDHIGRGFHRYSTDRVWLLPHFEKMLYDQAMLIMAYTEAFQATGKEEYKKTAEEVIGYVLRDMTSPEGGFYSAEDADSQGKEGKFYVWKRDEILKIIGEEEGRLFSRVYNIRDDGNFREEAGGTKSRENIPHITQSISRTATDLNIPENELKSRLEKAGGILFNEREKRVHPHKDDKILTDWNGLMIVALAKAARAFGKPGYVENAAKAVQFIESRMKDKEGRLLHSHREGKSSRRGFIDDYAFFIQGLLEMYQASFEVKYLKSALEYSNQFLNHFQDAENGGFYYTADDSEELLIRRKEIYDGAIPSGNSVAMMNLLRIFRITGDTRWEETTEEIGRAFYKEISHIPSAHCFVMSALEPAREDSREVVITGNPDSPGVREMKNLLERSYHPGMTVVFRPEGESPEICGLIPFTKEMKSLNGKATAYICRNHACQNPVTDPKEMMKRLGD